MFAKPFTDITLDDIKELVFIRKQAENHSLDYKKELTFTDHAKTELSKDISAFANANGGWLIIGVDEKENQICGTAPLFGRQKVDEWISNVIVSFIEPKPFYHLKVISIGESAADRVVVLINVPESSKRPHYVNQKNHYYIRSGTVINVANHYEIRDMFEISRKQVNDTERFLAHRNLLNDNDPDFGLNQNSRELKNKITTDIPGQAKPMVIFSLVPKFINEVKFNGTVAELREWTGRNSSGHFPLHQFSLFYASRFDTKLDGIVYKYHESKGYLTSYFEVNNKGYVECGMSQWVAVSYKKRYSDGIELGINLTGIVGYMMLLLGFAKKFYEKMGYYDEISIQVSFVNVLHFRLFGFHHHYSNLVHYDDSAIQNNQYERFKLIENFVITGLSDEKVTSIAEHVSTSICNAFGLEKDFCFVDKTINLQSLSYLKL